MIIVKEELFCHQDSSSFFFKKMRQFLFILFLILSFPVGAVTVEEAANSPEWLALVHYRPALLWGVKSTIDSDNFFLGKKGKTDPLAEIKATIDLFNGTNNEKKCFFPARHMLLSQMGLIHTPFPKCPEWESFWGGLKPRRYHVDFYGCVYE